MNAYEAYDAIYSVIESIPRGRVATYGQVAEIAGLPRRARMVGRALRQLPDDSGVPWHRVVNFRGGISDRGRGDSEREQRQLLKSEGVVFDGRGCVPLDRFRWEP